MTPHKLSPRSDTEHMMLYAEDDEGRVHYLHSPEVVHKRVKCRCIGCKRPLTPVRAGRPKTKSDSRQQAPHFRHAAGHQMESCGSETSFAAALRQLQELGTITLPQRRITANSVGISGALYEGWAEMPSQTVQVAGHSLIPEGLQIQFSDGRLLVVCRGGLAGGNSDEHLPERAVLTWTPPPEWSELEPGLLGLRVMGLQDARWDRHWDDLRLQDEARRCGQDQADQALDWLSPEALGEDVEYARRRIEAMSPGQRRETLLHAKVKEILAKATALRVPQLSWTARASDVEEETVDELGEAVCTLTLGVQDQRGWKVRFSAVTLEQRIGEMVPDVVCTLTANGDSPALFLDDWIAEECLMSELIGPVPDAFGPAPSKLLVEVIVTHGIDEVKRARIKKQGLPTLAIDLRRLGGTVTLVGLQELVLETCASKEWVWHPWLASLRQMAHDHALQTRDAHALKLMDRAALGRLYRERVIAWLEADAASSATANELRRRFERVADALEEQGVYGAKDRKFTQHKGVLSRLLSIEANRGIGYNFDTGWQVVNSIMGSTSGSRWFRVYAATVRAYGLHLKFKRVQRDTFIAWATENKDRAESGDAALQPDRRFFPLVAILFPRLAGLLQEIGDQ